MAYGIVSMAALRILIIPISSVANLGKASEKRCPAADVPPDTVILVGLNIIIWRKEFFRSSKVWWELYSMNVRITWVT